SLRRNVPPWNREKVVDLGPSRLPPRLLVVASASPRTDFFSVKLLEDVYFGIPYTPSPGRDKKPQRRRNEENEVPFEGADCESAGRQKRPLYMGIPCTRYSRSSCRS